MTAPCADGREVPTQVSGSAGSDPHAALSARLAVVVVTYRRPDFVKQCLDALARQDADIEVVVVDASPDDSTQRIVLSRSGVGYVRNPNGPGHMTQSRNIGYRHTSSSVVAFVDDDAFVHPGWAAAISSAYSDDTVGGVGGRALNGQPGEADIGADAIGQLGSDGQLSGNFAADPGHSIDVDHFIGCNMSFRRSVLDELNGFRESFPGTALREDTDMCIRVRRLGYRLVFEPQAAVDHVGAPHVKGRRFDLRYQYFGQRNHVAMLIWNFGLGAMTRGYLRVTLTQSVRAIAVSVLKLGLWLLATGAGVLAGVRERRHGGTHLEDQR